MELHLGVVVVVVQAEGLVGGQHVEQLPLALVHEQAVVFLQLLGAPHQRDVDVFDCSVAAQGSRQPSHTHYSNPVSREFALMRTNVNCVPEHDCLTFFVLHTDEM